MRKEIKIYISIPFKLKTVSDIVKLYKRKKNFDDRVLLKLAICIGKA